MTTTADYAPVPPVVPLPTGGVIAHGVTFESVEHARKTVLEARALWASRGRDVLVARANATLSQLDNLLPA